MRPKSFGAWSKAGPDKLERRLEGDQVDIASAVEDARVNLFGEFLAKPSKHP